jgi:condensin-2 complex subunit G2
MRAADSGKAADVKACYLLRGAMPLYDWEDASINDLKGMLLRCAITPAFLRRPEGRKLLGFLFTLHPQMVRELTSVIRNQVGAQRLGAGALAAGG